MMGGRQAAAGRAWLGWFAGQYWLALGVVGAAALILGAMYVLSPPSAAGALIFLGAASLLALVLGLRSPVLATFYLMATTFLRLAIPQVLLPFDPFVLAFAIVLAAMAIWLSKREQRQPVLGAIEILIGLYILWNVASMILPHSTPATEPFGLPGFSVGRFVLIGTVMPLAMFVAGRLVFDSEKVIRQLLWAVVLAGGYSAFVSIMPFHGAESAVWPRYIVTAAGWPGRAVGVFNQPVVNGIVLIYGFLAAVLLASHAGRGWWTKAVAVLVAGACAYGVYLTHTRAIWLAFVVVLIVGALWAKGFRAGFVTGLVAVAVGAVVNWTVLISSDRSKGGVGSVSEVHDRMNTLATSFWAIRQRPLAGWGIGRFPAINTYNHKQWSTETPWIRGFGIASHFNELGIFAELGLIGLLLWLSILVLIGIRLVLGFRSLPEAGLCNRPLALTAIMVFGVQITAGLTVDLRFFDFPNIVGFLLAGVVVGCVDRRLRQRETPSVIEGPGGTVPDGSDFSGPQWRGRYRPRHVVPRAQVGGLR